VISGGIAISVPAGERTAAVLDGITPTDALLNESKLAGVKALIAQRAADVAGVQRAERSLAPLRLGGARSALDQDGLERVAVIGAVAIGVPLGDGHCGQLKVGAS
jgi:hypothetical protein